MKIRIEKLCLQGVCNLCCEMEINGCTLLYDPSETNAAGMLKALVDSSTIATGGIYLDDIAHATYYETHAITETFAYIFDAGIMLSNLSIRENLLLPYRIRFQEGKLEDFDTHLNEYKELFELDFDENERPAFIKPAILKQICYIRSLLLSPKVLLIDNPYYLLNRFERHNLLRVLKILKTRIPMIIASTDTDFQPPFADTLLVWKENTQKFEKSVAIS